MANWKITTGNVSRTEYIGGGPSYVVNTVTIPSTANEQTAPSKVYYVAKWGNDTNGNGSRDRPYLTIAKACTLIPGDGTGYAIVVGTGVYNSVVNTPVSSGVSIIGDGKVVLEGTSLNNLVANNLLLAVAFYNVTIQNYVSVGYTGTLGTSFNNCIIRNVGSVIFNTLLSCSSNVFYNITTLIESYIHSNFPFIYFSKVHKNNTYINIKNIATTNTVPIWVKHYNIYKNCNLQFLAATSTDYNIYNNCNFRFNATSGGTPASLPESSSNTYIPSGWITPRPSTGLEIQNAQATAFGTTSGFSNSLIQSNTLDPNFNNISLEDFTLQSTSPARNFAYEGTFVGAKSVGTPLKFRTVEANGDFKNSLSTNLTIVDNSATLTNSANTATIESNVIDLGKDKVLRALSMLGLLGDRNGEWVDSSTDLDSVTTASGSNLLIANQSYIVETGTVTYNGGLYQVGQKFAVISGTLDYTPTGGGVVRRILEAPNRVCYEMRISSISAVDCEAQSYFKYEFNTQPTVNRFSDVATNAIQYGNGELLFRRGATQIFLVSARWIQLRLVVQNNNLV